MKRCRVHRVRYAPLWRLPSVRTIGTTAAVTIAVAVISAGVAPTWVPIAVVATGAAGLAVEMRRHRHRLALEAHMIRALMRSRRGCPESVDVQSLSADVRAQVTADGVTRIEAESWRDAVVALGFVTGRDRAFQLEWLRRMAAGRLSEICGSPALPVDTRYRALGLAGAADRALECLEQEELELLQAFASGVTAAWNQDGPPFECRFLSYRPEPWRPADSLLIALLVFHALSWNEQTKRAEAVIRRVFPDPVARFFLPGDGGPDPALPEHLDRFRAAADPAADFITVDRVVAGSNCWIKSGPEGPILACDLHVPLSMPNLLYEADLRWSGRRVRGLMAAGLPVVLTGSNEHLVWGVTNLHGDVLDLIPAGAAKKASTRPVTERERIRVRGRPDAVLDVARAGTSRVSASPLLGEDVLVCWTGDDARSCDLRFQRLAQATSVEESIAILDRAHGTALNVLVADEAGRMAHLATGLLPRRHADSRDCADGYLTGPERPRLVDPPDGVLVSANDAALPGRPYRIGYDLDPGHRARRVRRMLAECRDANPAAMRAMQHDARAEVYVPYRDLAVSALRARADRDVASVLSAWNGNADVESVAFGVLVRLREVLARRVLSPYLSVCRDRDPEFTYAFQTLDRPLLAIIRSGDPALLPPGEEGDGWDGFVARCVEGVAADLRRSSRRGNLPAWGELNRVGLRHPLEDLAPWAGSLLGVAATPQAGAVHCVRTCVPGFAAVGRAVLRPGPHGGAEFETPGGQSGHPLSSHYDDRHRDWSSGTPRGSRRPGRECRFVLRAA